MTKDNYSSLVSDLGSGLSFMFAIKVDGVCAEDTKDKPKTTGVSTHDTLEDLDALYEYYSENMR